MPPAVVRSPGLVCLIGFLHIELLEQIVLKKNALVFIAIGSAETGTILFNSLLILQIEDLDNGISCMAAIMRNRLDRLLVHRKFAATRQKAQAMIEAGQIQVNGLPALKSSSMVDMHCHVEITGEPCPYVSRGGYKLAHALEYFNINPIGLVCADIGASTGGFTDCLLQKGAQRVYAIDVGYGQLAWKIRQDPRVTVMERTNARLLKEGDLPPVLDLVVIDASFISLKKLLPPILPFFAKQPAILALIKPQFEVGRELVGKGGIVRDHFLHREVTDDIANSASFLGLQSKGVTESPLLGSKGNREFLIYLCT
jgi:23S rRNA (cytidine1920-2'-O)/16S rRNA (cytidine1409-2'-O)-methyltransferase